MKKLLLVLLILTLMSVSFADDDIEAHAIDVYVDGILMDTYDYEQNINMPAFIYNSRTMLPLKRTFLLFGIKGDQITWHPEDRSITVMTNEMDRIWMQIDNYEIKLNDESVISDVAPVVFNNRTYVPLAIVSSLLGEVPKWHKETRSVTMNPSRYQLGNFSVRLDRKLGYTVPQLTVAGTYAIEKINLETEAIIEYMNMTIIEKSFKNAFEAMLEENHLASEDFKMLTDEIFYRDDPRGDRYIFAKAGLVTFEANSSNFSMTVLKALLESVEGGTNEN